MAAYLDRPHPIERDKKSAEERKLSDRKSDLPSPPPPPPTRPHPHFAWTWQHRSPATYTTSELPSSYFTNLIYNYYERGYLYVIQFKAKYAWRYTAFPKRQCRLWQVVFCMTPQRTLPYRIQLSTVPLTGWKNQKCMLLEHGHGLGSLLACSHTKNTLYFFTGFLWTWNGDAVFPVT
jgi:hypothetical protein